jgi:osmoprotectant transport system permease protein
MRREIVIVLFVVGLAGPAAAAEGAVVGVGSKAFTESVILGEMAAQLAEDDGFQAEHVEGLGGTRLLWEAIVAGKIDVYPEYVGR